MDMVACPYTANSFEAKAGEFQVRNQFWIHREFKAIRLCSEVLPLTQFFVFCFVLDKGQGVSFSGHLLSFESRKEKKGGGRKS